MPGLPVPPVLQEVTSEPQQTTVTVAAPAAFEVREVRAEPEEEPARRQPIEDAYRAVTPEPAPASSTPVTWQTLLRSPTGAREAIVLREIFGPPRSMRPPDDRALI
jgi:hypothetical protein